MKVIRDTNFCVTNWSALSRRQWPSLLACANQIGPIKWSWPKRVTPLAVKYLLNASETYELAGRVVTTDPGSYLIINEGTEYASHVDSQKDVETACVFISPELVENVLASISLSTDQLLTDPHKTSPSINFVERLYPRDDRVVPSLLNIRKLVHSGGTDAQIQEGMHVLVENLLLMHAGIKSEIDQLSFAKAKTREEIYRRLHICRDFMLSNLEKTQSLEEIAAVAGFARHHFLRVFRQVFGTTPHQYLTGLRLDKARQMVRTTDKPISQICLDVGFESVSSFSTLYSRSFQLSPIRDRQAD